MGHEHATEDGEAEECDLVQEEDVKSAEARPDASLGSEMLHGGTYFGGDGFGLDDEKLGFHSRFILVIGLLVGIDAVIGFGAVDLERRDGRCFDHRQSGHDLAVGVLDLKTDVSAPSPKGQFGAR